MEGMDTMDGMDGAGVFPVFCPCLSVSGPCLSVPNQSRRLWEGSTAAP